MNDPECQPHIRMAMRIHVIEEARHMAFVKEELAKGMQEFGPLTRVLTRMMLANCALVLPVLGILNPALYRAAGVGPIRGVIQTFFNKRYGQNVKRAYGPLARQLYDGGFLSGGPVRFVWRLSRALPDDLRARMRNEQRVAHAV